MAYSITKQPDGDVNFGSWNGEYVALQPAAADYSPGGYAIIDGESVVNTPSLQANCDMYKVIAALPVGGQGGYVPVLNPVNKRLQVFRQTAATGALAEVPNLTDLSAQTFYLLLMGL